MATYAIINGNTNLVENISADDRPIEEIVLPAPYFVVPIQNTPCVVWLYNDAANEYFQEETHSMGGTGDTWDGQKFIRPRPAI